MSFPRRVAALVGMALAVAACQSPSRSVSQADNPPPEGVLRVAVEAPASLDPAQARSPSEVLLAEQLFDGLTAYDPATLAVKPALAAAWQPSPDFKHWNFTLRPDAKFGNGRQIISADVKYSLERIARRGSTSRAVAELELISGFKAFYSTGKSDTLAGITTPAPNVVHFDLDEPLAVLPTILGNPTFGIVPRESVEAAPPAPAFVTKPIGSGPFVVQSRTDTQLTMTPTPWAQGVSLKAVDAVLTKDAASAYSEFVRGDVDWAEAPPDQTEPLPKSKGQDSFQAYVAESFYAFNLKNPKFGDGRFREAILHAIDRAAIVRVVYGSSALTPNGLVAQGVPGAQPDACGDVCRFDPVKAKALIAEVYPGKPPPELQIDFDDNPTQQAVAQAMQANLKSVGVEAHPRPHPFADYYKFLGSGQQELFRLGWIGSYPDPDAFLTPLYRTGVTDNFIGFTSPPVDALLAQGRSAPDPAQRTGAYQQAEKSILNQVPVVPVAQFQTHSVSAPRVRNLVVTTMGIFDATQVHLDG